VKVGEKLDPDVVGRPELSRRSNSLNWQYSDGILLLMLSWKTAGAPGCATLNVKLDCAGKFDPEELENTRVSEPEAPVPVYFM